MNSGGPHARASAGGGTPPGYAVAVREREEHAGEGVTDPERQPAVSGGDGAVGPGPPPSHNNNRGFLP